MKLECKQCGGAMKKKTISSGNCLGICIAILIFCAGVAFLFVPVLGWVAGPVLMIGALFIGGKRRKVWRCKSCGTIVDRH